MKENEQEVEAVLVLRKKMKLRTITGQLFTGIVEVYEVEVPYIIIVNVRTEHDHSARMDVHSEDLARELREWMSGKMLRNAMFVVPNRIEDVITKFVKFGKTPIQEDIIMWVLSRAELQWAPESKLVFGGILLEDKNGLLIDVVASDDPFAGINIANSYPTTTSAAIKGSNYRQQQNRIENSLNSPSAGDFVGRQSGVMQQHRKDAPPSSSPPRVVRANRTSFDEQDMGTHALTRELIGKSAALDQLKRSKVKGREGAKAVLTASQLTNEHWKLGSGIETARKEVERAMDVRRREIEVARTRQQQASERYGKIREKINNESGAGGWIKVATEELLSLNKIKDDIEADAIRQRAKAHRDAQRVMWTIAPSGYANRRGKSVRGAHLGPGPLPPNAISSMRDPLIDKTAKRFYWDVAGRRHARKADADANNGGGSLVDQAMEAIRKYAMTASSNKLDLRQVFIEFDTSGDGFLSMSEMAEAFFMLGVEMDAKTMIALFR